MGGVCENGLNNICLKPKTYRRIGMNQICIKQYMFKA